MAKVFVSTSGQRTVGITKLLKSVFCPGLTHGKLSCPPSNVGGLRKRSAKKRGINVDREITSFCNSKTKPILLETKHILEFLQQKKMSPLSSQVLTYSEKLGVSAVADLLAQGENGDHVVIEIKSGCIYRECTRKDKKLSPILGISQSFLLLHQLQVLVAKTLYKISNPTITVSGILIYTDGEKITAYEEENFLVKQLTPAMLMALSKAAAQVSTRRLKRKRTKKKTQPEQNKKQKK